MDRASDSGSEGWGFESLPAYHIVFAAGNQDGSRFCYTLSEQRDTPAKNSALWRRIFGKGQPQSNMPPACSWCGYFRRTITFFAVSQKTLFNVSIDIFPFCGYAAKRRRRERLDFSLGCLLI